MEIEKNIPIPEKNMSKSTVRDLIISKMEIGDSVLFPASEADQNMHHDYNGKARQSASSFMALMKKFGKKATSRLLRYDDGKIEGVRVWRIE
jgi:hypothetical protein